MIRNAITMSRDEIQRLSQNSMLQATRPRPEAGAAGFVTGCSQTLSVKIWSRFLGAAMLAAWAVCGASGPALSTAGDTAPWLKSYVDWDAYEATRGSTLDPLRMSTIGPTKGVAPHGVPVRAYLHEPTESWSWQFLPAGNAYPSYLAGVQEPRMQTNITWDASGRWYWEPELGGRIALLRYGNRDIFRPQGFEVAAEGAAIGRLDLAENVDLASVDFRGGLYASYAHGNHVTKLGYYHMSAHLGDEFLLKNPGFPRLNWARDAIVLGHTIYVAQDVRIYGEVAWAFYTDVSKEWEFQFGVEYAPVYPTTIAGAPFAAFNVHLREEVQFGGNLTAQAGWAWRSPASAGLFRIGLQYYNGESSQFSYYDRFEQQVTFGIWYDH